MHPRLSKSDLAEIEAAAHVIRKNVEDNRHAIGHNPIAILKTRVFGRQQPMDDFDFREVRARMSVSSGEITLLTFPLRIEDYDWTRTQLDAFEQWIGHALAHEVCHLLQLRNEPGWGDQWPAAVALNEHAASSRDYSDYLDYLEHPLEIEAHATQMAVQVRQQHSVGVDEAAFLAAAAASQLAGHIANHPNMKPAANDVTAGRITSVLKVIMGHAWIAYQHLT